MQCGKGRRRETEDVKMPSGSIDGVRRDEKPSCLEGQRGCKQNRTFSVAYGGLVEKM